MANRQDFIYFKKNHIYNKRGPMIFLDMTPNEFIKKFPSLGQTIKNKCKSEKIPFNKIKPYITKDYIGAILNPDSPNKIRCFTNREGHDINIENINKIFNSLKNNL